MFEKFATKCSKKYKENILQGVQKKYYWIWMLKKCTTGCSKNIPQGIRKIYYRVLKEYSPGCLKNT